MCYNMRSLFIKHKGDYMKKVYYTDKEGMIVEINKDRPPQH